MTPLGKLFGCNLITELGIKLGRLALTTFEKKNLGTKNSTWKGNNKKWLVFKTRWKIHYNLHKTQELLYQQQEEPFHGWELERWTIVSWCSNTDCTILVCSILWLAIIVNKIYLHVVDIISWYKCNQWWSFRIKYNWVPHHSMDQHPEHY